MEIIINMLLPTVYRERDRMAWEFALTRAKLSLPKISLHTSDLGDKKKKTSYNTMHNN